ncbi:type VI secretion system ImpA family N-terminal domain-containing protein, partial [Providencia rettgeri]
MTNNTPYSWKEQLLAHLDEQLVCSAVNDSDPDWEYIDSEMIKFGSLSHSQLDVKEIQRRCLRLLETQTKDFRLIVQLLRTLQHAGEPKELVLAAQILSDFTRQYWHVCYPTNIKLKLRLANQIIKRFESVNDFFCRSANSKMRDDILGSFAYLAQFRHEQSPEHSEQIDALSGGYQRIEESEQPIVLASAPKEAAMPITETVQPP